MDEPDYLGSFYNTKPSKKTQEDNFFVKDDREAKYVIEDEDAFDKGRKLIGGLIRHGMKTTGGTDIDWVIEHRGNFIIIEFKEIHREEIGIRLGQMLTYEKLHERLNQNGGKCYMYFVGCGYDLNFDNPNDIVWIFEMEEWKSKAIPFNTQSTSKLTVGGLPKKYFIEKDYMTEIKLVELEEKIDQHWDEFEKL